jgi:radical SAM superfamily enzyme YgiQ (UPF0313 family)
MRTLFLHPPSFDGFDGGAGARYQMKREVRSFWYPTWLAQPAALVEGSKLIDAPPHRLKFEDIAPELKNRDLVVMHTSTPSFKSDVKTADMIKAANPDIRIGFIGAKVAVEPEKSLIAARAVDFVARNEFDFTIKEVADGMRWSDIKGLSYRNQEGVIVHNENREVLENMDKLPWVTPVYKRDLTIENYFGGYLKHPYISFYTGRGCKSRCTFCLWPQTVGGHRYRVRSVEDVVAEMKWAKNAFPQVKEFFFDDDTLTDNLPRVEALAKELGKLGVIWSCNAKANVPRRTLEVMKDNGLRLLLVGYESGNQQILFNIKKGMRETIRETLDFAKEINPHTIQVSLAAPYPGTFLYRQAKENGWLYNEEIDLLTQEGTQIAALNYPHLSHGEIFESVEDFYKKFYFRPSKIAAIVAEMIASPEMMKRRLREGVEFFHFLRSRRDTV